MVSDGDHENSRTILTSDYSARKLFEHIKCWAPRGTDVSGFSGVQRTARNQRIKLAADSSAGLRGGLGTRNVIVLRNWTEYRGGMSWYHRRLKNC
jgi:hypothetical protein